MNIAMSAKTIAVSEFKGGVGKTTTTISVGAYIASKNKRVLLIDLDPQGCLTVGLGYSKNQAITIKNKLEDVIMCVDNDPFDGILHHIEGMDVITTNKLLGGFEALNGIDDKEMLLKEYLDKVKGEYDFVFVDCPPHLGDLTRNALCAADSVLIPVQPRYLDIDGMTDFISSINSLKRRFNPSLSVEGIIYTMDNANYNNSKDCKALVQQKFGNKYRIYDFSIPRSEKMAEVTKSGKSIFSFDKHNKGAISYEKLAKEVLANA